MQQKNELLQAIFDHIPVMICLFDANGHFQWANPEWETILGWGVEDIQERDLLPEFYPDPEYRQHFLDFIAAGERRWSEFKTHTRDGRILDTTWANVRLRDGTTIGIGQDISERKQAQEELRRSEEQRRLVLDLTHTGFWDWQITTDEITWNDNHYHLLGLVPNSVEPTYQTWRDRIHSEDIDRVEQVVNHALDIQTDFETEYRVIYPDGSHHWLMARGRGIYDESGQAVRMVGMLFDISDRARAEAVVAADLKDTQLLRDLSARLISEDDIQVLYNEIVATAIALMRADGGSFQILDETTQELVLLASQNFDRTMIEHFYRVDTHLNTSCGIALATGERAFVDFDVPKSNDLDGYLRMHVNAGYLYAQSTPLISRSGKLIGMVSTHWRNHHRPSDRQLRFLDLLARQAADLIEQRQSQEKIREQAALLDVTTDAILVRDLDCRILYWNSGAERMYGWQAAEVLNKDCREFLYKEISPSVQEALTTVVEQGECHGELNKITKSGQEIIVSSRWTLVRDETGQPKSILVVDTDITEKKQLEQQFYRAQRLESLGTLASGIAHDLNNILTPILTVAQLLPLKFPNLDQQNRELLEILENSSKRGTQLVKQILSFAQGAERKLVPLQPKHLLKEIEQVVKSTFPKSIEICTKIATPNLWAVLADPIQTHQVLMNLCVNARDAMPNGGILTLSAENFRVDQNYARMNLEANVGDYVLITVSDTGCGIPQDVIERIFEPFFTTKESGKGTGLGLATVIGIIKNDGGFVNVHSEVGKGSQFQLYLRAIDTSITREVDDFQMDLGNGELILVVDDEAFVRDVTKTSLEELNYRVLIASDGVEAFSLYIQHKDEISVVLMDIQMPSIDGLNTIRILQRMNPKVKIIAISGLTSNQKLLETAGIHVQAFLPKPYTIKELLETIKGV
ncbi:MAG: PAS domain S-box protein [Fischerella sp. CENA71]|nr:PAS domain S-box protein [Fischerella sp. CENA71]